MKKPPEYITKQQASELLDNLSLRRIDELIKEQNWVTRKEKRDGWRNPNRVIRYEDVKAYKASLSAPTIDVGEPGTAVVKREKAGQGSGAPAVLEAFAGLADKLVKLSEFHAQLLERLAPKPPVYAAHQFITLKKAALHVGLSRNYLEAACDDRRLAFIVDGPPSRQRRMVRVADVESLAIPESKPAAFNRTRPAHG